MVNTRASNSSTCVSDPQIERMFLRRLRESVQSIVLDFSMVDANGTGARKLRDLMNPDLTQQPLAVTVPALNIGVNFELKTGFINLLPKFRGLSMEDPIMHLSEFHDICMCSKPGHVTKEQIKMRALGFMLKDTARKWFYHLPSGTIDTWPKLHKAFLDKYFPSKKAVALQRAIANVEQADDESLYDYLEMFTKLCASWPFHGFDERDLVFNLYNGLRR